MSADKGLQAERRQSIESLFLWMDEFFLTKRMEAFKQQPSGWHLSMAHADGFDKFYHSILNPYNQK